MSAFKDLKWKKIASMGTAGILVADPILCIKYIILYLTCKRNGGMLSSWQKCRLAILA